MKAILLAGGKGTRLRPLTLHTPKPIVPVFGRAFLNYQIDLVRSVPEIDEVILSLNYQPRRIQEVFGDGHDLGIRISYVVEPSPLGTGGAIKYATGAYNDTIVVFNGDVMTQINLAEVIRLHRERKAKATIVLTPVDNPTAYGLVETDADGNVRRFLEKPKPEEITCDTINAGVYVLEPETFDRIPKDTAWSIERSFFPSLVERQETFVAYVYRGYWIDIGTPEKYVQVHRDIMDRRFLAEPFGSQPRGAVFVAPTARIEEGARVEGPCFIDEGTVVKAGARVLPYSVIGRNSVIEEDAVVDGAIIWPNGRISRDATVRRCILGRHCHVGRDAVIDAGTILGDKSAVTDFSRLATTILSQEHRCRSIRRSSRPTTSGASTPTELNEETARQIGRAFVAYLGATRIAVGRDMRVSAPVDGRRLHRGRADAGRRRRRLRDDRHRHALLRGGAGQARGRRDDHRVAQPEGIHRDEARARRGVPAERRRGHRPDPRHDRRRARSRPRPRRPAPSPPTTACSTTTSRT